jgi:hypothetical protein
VEQFAPAPSRNRKEQNIYASEKPRKMAQTSAPDLHFRQELFHVEQFAALEITGAAPNRSHRKFRSRELR